MDGGEGMSMQGSTPYYFHGTIPGSSAGFRPSLSPIISAQPINYVAPMFNANKKKRGRPRKYGTDGYVPGSGSGTIAFGVSSNSSTSGGCRKRGRPPGSGWKQRLSTFGECMNNSAGMAFTPHVTHVAPGEGPRDLCIMSGSGGVSSVTLSQPASAAGTVPFKTCNRLNNDNIDIVSRVKVEVSNENDAQPEKAQCEVIASQHENECPSQDKKTRSHENDHGFEFPNHSSSNFGAQPMDPQPVDDGNQSLASQNENDSPKGSSTSGIGMTKNSDGLESLNHTTSNSGSHPMEPQLGNVQSEYITLGNKNDFPKGASTNGIGVAKDSSHILQAITAKYGDITEGCTLLSEFFKVNSLKGICMIVEKIHNTCLAKLKSDDLKTFYEIVKDAESVKFNVKWLREYLDDIVKAMEKIKEHEKLEIVRREVQQKEEELEKVLKMKEEEKVRLELEINQLKEKLLIENTKAEELTAKINSLPSPFSASII